MEETVTQKVKILLEEIIVLLKENNAQNRKIITLLDKEESYQQLSQWRSHKGGKMENTSKEPNEEEAKFLERYKERTDVIFRFRLNQWAEQQFGKERAHFLLNNYTKQQPKITKFDLKVTVFDVWLPLFMNFMSEKPF